MLKKANKKNKIRLNNYKDINIVEDNVVSKKTESEQENQIIFNNPPHFIGTSQIWTYEQFKLNILRTVPTDFLTERGYGGVKKNSLTYLASFAERFLMESREELRENLKGSGRPSELAYCKVNNKDVNHLKELFMILEKDLKEYQPLYWEKISPLLFFDVAKTCDKCGSYIKGSFEYGKFLARQKQLREKETGKKEVLFNDWIKKPSSEAEENLKEIKTRHRLCEMPNEQGMHYIEVMCKKESDGKWTCEYKYPEKLVKIKEGERPVVTTRKKIVLEDDFSSGSKINKKPGAKRGYAYDGLSLEEALKHSTPVSRQKDKVKCSDCKGIFAKRYFYSHYRKHIS